MIVYQKPLNQERLEALPFQGPAEPLLGGLVSNGFYYRDPGLRKILDDAMRLQNGKRWSRSSPKTMHEGVFKRLVAMSDLRRRVENTKPFVAYKTHCSHLLNPVVAIAEIASLSGQILRRPQLDKDVFEIDDTALEQISVTLDRIRHRFPVDSLDPTARVAFHYSWAVKQTIESILWTDCRRFSLLYPSPLKADANVAGEGF